MASLAEGKSLILNGAAFFQWRGHLFSKNCTLITEYRLLKSTNCTDKIPVEFLIKSGWSAGALDTQAHQIFAPDKLVPVPCEKAPLIELDDVLFDPRTLKIMNQRLVNFWQYKNNFAALEKHQRETFSWNRRDEEETLLEAEQPVGGSFEQAGKNPGSFSAGVTHVTDWFSDLWGNFKRFFSILLVIGVLLLVIGLCRWCRCYRCFCMIGRACCLSPEPPTDPSMEMSAIRSN